MTAVRVFAIVSVKAAHEGTCILGTFTGPAGYDTLVGTAGADYLQGLGGNET